MDVKMKFNKKFILISNIMLLSSTACLYSKFSASSTLKNLSLITTPTFYEFMQEVKEFDNQNWAWLVSITIKSKNKITIQRLNLKWDGDYINTSKISASLYEKKHNQNILKPISENFICDGYWNKDKQEIIFNLNKTMSAVKKYYLVLNFPQKLKSKLQSGTFKSKHFKIQ